MRDLDATSTLLREARGPGYDVAAAVPLATELGALLPTSDNAVALGLHKP